MASLHTETLRSGVKSYRVAWRDPGTGKQRSKRFPRYDDARRYKTKIESSIDTHEYVDPMLGRITLAEMIEHYRTTAPIGETTATLYEIHARKWIVPYLGAKKLLAISKPDCRMLLSRIKADGAGSSTVKHVLQLLRAVLEMAVDEERIPKNSARGIKLETHQEREGFFLTAPQVRELAREVPERFATFIRFLAYTGLRLGEARSLKVRDIDLMRKTVTVVRGGGTRNATKSRKIRVVPIPAFFTDTLAEHLATYTDPADPDALVFTADRGGAINENNFRKRVFTPAAIRAGILRDEEPPTPHDLRHTAASLLAASGYSIHEVSKILGHSSIAITHRLYVHLFPEEQDRKAAQFDQMLRNAELEDTTPAKVVEI